MPAVAAAPDFEQALGDLQDHLPFWWRTQDPASNLYDLLEAIAGQIDNLSVLFEQPYLDQSLTTASAAGLQRNFAFAWGLTREQIPSVLSQLVAYIQARSSEDGTLGSMLNTLTSLVNTPVNTTGGPVLTFPAAGGLTFPDVTGLSNLVFVFGVGITLPATFGGQPAGLIMFEFPAGSQPVAGLIFPLNGSGLRFSVNPSSLPSDNVIVQDGTSPIGAGSGLTFASNGFVNIIQGFTTYTLTVQVQNWLAFDRGAFQRAVGRFQPAHCLPASIVEVTAYI